MSSIYNISLSKFNYKAYRSLQVILLLFGGLLYLSDYGIDNPQMSPIPALGKDALVLIVFTMILLKKDKLIFDYYALCYFALLLFCSLLLLFYPLFYRDWHPFYEIGAETKVLKSILMYIVMGTFVAYAVFKSRSLYDLKRSLVVSLGFCIVISALVFMFMPDASVTGRNFGVVGNPNTLAMLSALTFFLVFSQRCTINMRSCFFKGLVLISSAFCLVTAASVTGVLLFLLFIIVSVKFIYFPVLIIAPLFFLFLGDVRVPESIDWQLINRLDEHLLGIATSDSMHVRLDGYLSGLLNETPSVFIMLDATASTLLSNYYGTGVIFIVVMLLPVLIYVISGSFYYDYRRGNRDGVIISLFIMIGIFVQYTFIFFPGVFLYGALSIYLMKSSRISVDYQ